jgi:hypothetical protein
MRGGEAGTKGQKQEGAASHHAAFYVPGPQWFS